MSSDTTPSISVVLPVWNEEENLAELRGRLDAVRGRLGGDLEIILVDDHSTDSTGDILRRWRAEDDRVRWIRFSRNFGSHAACRAGIELAAGDAIVIMAADLQDPPEDLPRLVDAWREGHQVVWAVRTDRPGEGASTTLGARLYYWLMRRIAKVDLPPEGADFVLIDRRVADAILRLPERMNSIFAELCWAGFRSTEVEYVKHARHAGSSGWTLRKKVRLALDSLIGFTPFPLRALAAIGLLLAAFGAVYAVVLVGLRLAGGIEVPGFTALMIVLLLGFGSVLVMIGVLGEYLWRTLEETRRRPHYLVEDESEAREEPER